VSTICGHFVQNGKIKSTDLYDMLKKMEHRGPDTHGVYLDGKLDRVNHIDELKGDLSNETHIALGHSRLEIMGKEKITQPYISCNGKIALIHNGEIFNYQEQKT
jgi:asparagine synthase (glutamine-hydrolysing)